MKTIGILRCFQWESKDGLGPIGGVAMMYRAHLLRLYRENGLAIKIINTKKDLKGIDCLHIPVIQKFTAEDHLRKVVKEAKKRRLVVSSTLHGDILEINRLVKPNDNVKELIELIDNFAFVGSDQVYPKKATGRNAILTVHPYYPHLAYPYGRTLPFTGKEMRLLGDERGLKRSGFACWTTVTNQKQIHLIPRLLGWTDKEIKKPEKVHIFGNTGGIAYWYLKKFPEELKKGLAIERKIPGGDHRYNDYSRFLSYRYGFNLSPPPPYGSKRSEYVTMEMFDLGLIPIFFEGWNAGYKGIELPNPIYKINKETGVIRYKVKQKKAIKAFQEQLENLEKDPNARREIVQHNRKYLYEHHNPDAGLKAWLKVLGI